ncbi:MAG: hypothetical protein AAGJ86_11095 [Pseudomonadota bacterium]
MTRARTVGMLLMLAGGALASESLGDDSFDFFDYLGSMVEQEGEWIDPVAMDFETTAEAVDDVDESVPAGVEAGEDDG